MIVCFEGIDGSGKSTQAKELVNALNLQCLDNNKQRIADYFSITDYTKRVAMNKDPEVISDTDNYVFDVATVRRLIDRERIIRLSENIDMILKLLRLNRDYDKGQKYLFDQLATRYLELARSLFKVFSTYDNRNYIIVLDRWLWSTIAYNAANNGCIFEELMSDKLNKGSINILECLTYKITKPDLLFYLDADLNKTEVARIQRGDTDPVLENSDYQNRVKASYDKILNKSLEYNSENYMPAIYPNIVHTIKVENRSISDIRKEVLEVFKANRI